MACIQAAAEGLIQTLKWLRERGCPWTAKAYEAARFKPQTQKWLRENGCPMPPEKNENPLTLE